MIRLNGILPSMYTENFSHAHVLAKASFSVWAYQHFVSLTEREAYAIGFHCIPSFCSKTAPLSPYKEAPAETFVGASGS